MQKYRETLRGHGHPIFKRDGFRCRYCGFDGSDFLSWQQLTLDHVVPRSASGTNEASNLVTCCSSCNSITSRIVFQEKPDFDNAFAAKMKKINKRHNDCRLFWESEVFPETQKG
ncbi:MAG: hypothetical protein GC164_10320 [Phycisphaera sp.]|nr:hypothetical protein [Phycisphaera sp.]